MNLTCSSTLTRELNDYPSLLRALTKGGVDFVVAGGTAAVLHGATTDTYDLDVLVRFDLDKCRRLFEVLAPLPPRFSHTPDKRPVQLTPEELDGFKDLQG